MKGKLALGTVQFGLSYGVTNQSGQVEIDEVKKILNYAEKNNIETLDTASLYGNSEKVLGEIGVHDYQIITKTIPLKDDVDKVVDGFYKSLKNLNKEQVEGLLIHNIKDIENKKFDALFNKLNEFKDKGLVKKIGFSTYLPEQIDFLLENFDFDLIQLPFNVFDTRLIKGGQLKALQSKGVEIHARSVFLQGILLDFGNFSDYFSTWQKQFGKYQTIVEESGLSLLEYALNFALSIKEIDKVLVGVHSERQLREIVQAVKSQGSLDAYPINDVKLLNPNLWSDK
jgi:aryl-alcohol dehydrogenase-like predicted oxidoreductase